MAVNASQAFTAASKKWNVPSGVLFGVYGMETSFGQNITTSSAGAVGPFQFIPSTAASYGYPLTNRPSDQQFLKQLDAAAHYLSDLYHKTGSWNAALQHYSGGGYGLAQVQKKANTKELAAAGILGPVITWGGDFLSGQTPAQGAASSGGQVSSSVTDFLGQLTQASTWFRVLKVIGGVILLVLGLRQLAAAAGASVGSKLVAG